MQFTYYGHACFSLIVNEKHLLFDPFISPNELAKQIDINSIKADYMLISHGHEDHVADALKIDKLTGAKVVGSWELTAWLAKHGLENYHPMNTGGKWNFDFGTVKCTVAQHSSAMPDGSYGGNPMGFVVTDKAGKSVYYAGDTSLTMDMKLLANQTNPLACAILPIGDNFTMGYEDAALAAEFCGVKKVIGVHFDTFGFIKIDHKRAIEYFASKGLTLILPEIGQTIEL